MTEHEAGPREVLRLWRQAVIDRSVDDIRRVYAEDAVHEFPFTRPGLPSRLQGREEILNWTTSVWTATPLRFERYRTLAIHDTHDPDTIIIEQDALGTRATTGEFVLPSIVVFTVHNGQISHLRDYVNILAATEAIEHDI